MLQFKPRGWNLTLKVKSSHQKKERKKERELGRNKSSSKDKWLHLFLRYLRAIRSISDLINSKEKCSPFRSSDFSHFLNWPSSFHCQINDMDMVISIFSGTSSTLPSFNLRSFTDIMAITRMLRKLLSRKKESRHLGVHGSCW